MVMINNIRKHLSHGYPQARTHLDCFPTLRLVNIYYIYGWYYIYGFWYIYG